MAPRRRALIKSVHSPDQRVFCELMTEIRDKRELTQAKLAGRLGKHQSFVAKYEGGERRIDVLEFIAIARALGRDPVRLLRTLIRRLG